MSFQILNESVFDITVEAFTNTINCVGAMGAGIALEFKKRYPKMYEDYKHKCSTHAIRPGDCYCYFDEESQIYLLGLAVKDDWKQWATLEWMESSLKSFKLCLLEKEIKSVNLPLLGGKNGRRGPYGRVSNMTPPPDNKEDIIKIVGNELKVFSDKFNITINLCIPDENNNSIVKKEDNITKITLDNFS